MLSRRFGIILLYVMGLATLSWYWTGGSWMGIDDANIYLVYMRNLAQGDGLVYNIGDERVEGFTSLLWTLVGAFFYLFTNHAVFALWVVNILLVSYTLLQVTRYLDGPNVKNFSPYTIFFLFLIGCTPGFIEWTVTTLMDTGLWTCLLTLTTLHTLRGEETAGQKHYYVQLSAWLVLLLLCRPESILWVPVFLTIAVLRSYGHSKDAGTVARQLSIPILSSILLFAGIILWRIWYFGYPLPNTYYAKVSSDWLNNLQAGRIYVTQSLREIPMLLILGAVIAYRLIKNRFARTFIFSVEFTLILLLGVLFLVPLYTGGDHFLLYRFLVPGFPLVFLLATRYLRQWSRSRYFLLLIGLAFILTNRYNPWKLATDHPLKDEWLYASQGRQQGVFLNQFFKERVLPSQGVLGAGGTGYGYAGKTIDLLGLNNTRMAHARTKKDRDKLKNHGSFSKDVFFELKPDLLWYPFKYYREYIELEAPLKIDTNQFYCQTYDQLHLDPRFRQTYDLFQIRRRDNGNELKIFAKKEYVATLDTGLYRVRSLSFE